MFLPKTTLGNSDFFISVHRM